MLYSCIIIILTLCYEVKMAVRVNQGGLATLVVNEYHGPDQSLTTHHLTKYVRPIPLDYIEIKGLGAYKLFPNEVTWSEAREICENDKAHLPVTRSRLERIFLTDYAIGLNIWMGIHDLYEEDIWMTIFNEFYDSLPYKPEISNGNFTNFCGLGDPRCVILGVNATLNNIPCTEIHRFVCKINPS